MLRKHKSISHMKRTAHLSSDFWYYLKFSTFQGGNVKPKNMAVSSMIECGIFGEESQISTVRPIRGEKALFSRL